MEYKELIQRVGWGEEFQFFYNEEMYWISQNKEGRYLTKVNGSQTQTFKTSEELFQYGRIDGKSILEIWEEIKQYF